MLFDRFSLLFRNVWKNEFQLEVYEIFLIAAERFVLLFFRPFLCIATPNPEFLLLLFFSWRFFVDQIITLSMDYNPHNLT